MSVPPSLNLQYVYATHLLDAYPTLLQLKSPESSLSSLTTRTKIRGTFQFKQRFLLFKDELSNLAACKFCKVVCYEGSWN